MQLRPATWGRIHRQRSSEHLQALADPNQPEPFPRQLRRLHANTVVTNAAVEKPGMLFHFDDNPLSVGVLADVRDRFLDQAIDCCFHQHGQRSGDPCRKRRRDAAPDAQAINEESERRHEAKIVEDARAQLVGELAELLLDCLEVIFHFIETVARDWRDELPRFGQRGVGRRQDLTGFVMKCLPDRTRLFLEGSVDAPERILGATVPTMRPTRQRNGRSHRRTSPTGVLLCGLTTALSPPFACAAAPLVCCHWGMAR